MRRLRDTLKWLCVEVEIRCMMMRYNIMMRVKPKAILTVMTLLGIVMLLLPELMRKCG